jgi:hypothetical protein
MVKADLDDSATLPHAFEDATAIFAYTDFGGIMSSPDMMARFQTGEVKAPLGKAASAIDVKHGKNIADAAASVPGLERLVWSTLPDVAKCSGGKYTGIYHLQGKTEVAQYIFGLRKLEGKVSCVMLGPFAENVRRQGTERVGMVKVSSVGRSMFFCHNVLAC